jgi:hypothetical protein
MGLVKFRPKSLRSKVGLRAESTTFCHLLHAGLESGRELSLRYFLNHRERFPSPSFAAQMPPLPQAGEESRVTSSFLARLRERWIAPWRETERDRDASYSNTCFADPKRR